MSVCEMCLVSKMAKDQIKDGVTEVKGTKSELVVPPLPSPNGPSARPFFHLSAGRRWMSYTRIQINEWMNEQTKEGRQVCFNRSSYREAQSKTRRFLKEISKHSEPMGWGSLPLPSKTNPQPTFERGGNSQGETSFSCILKINPSSKHRVLRIWMASYTSVLRNFAPWDSAQNKMEIKENIFVITDPYSFYFRWTNSIPGRRVSRKADENASLGLKSSRTSPFRPHFQVKTLEEKKKK